MNTTPISDDLLARYVAGEATKEETLSVQHWLTNDATAKEALAHYQKIWDTAHKAHSVAVVNTDAAWQKVKSAIQPQSALQEEPPTVVLRRSTFTTYWRIAASVVMVLGLGGLGYFWMQNTPKPALTARVIKAGNHTLEQTLSDGTKVFLNRNTSLTLSDDFNEEIRRVSLTGEAYFEVKRDVQKPFVIEANGTEVRVLGTSFNVKAYDSQVKVAVTSGKVAVAHRKATTILTKGQAATVQADTIVQMATFSPNALAYRTKIFVFEKTALENVVASLREGYQADIRLRHRHLASCQLTARFERETLDNTLSVIAETLHLKVIHEGNQIILDGVGCQ